MYVYIYIYIYPCRGDVRACNKTVIVENVCRQYCDNMAVGCIYLNIYIYGAVLYDGHPITFRRAIKQNMASFSNELLNLKILFPSRDLFINVYIFRLLRRYFAHVRKRQMNVEKSKKIILYTHLIFNRILYILFLFLF
jgi:hypothetical protein